MKKTIPLVKEYRIKKLIEILTCFDQHPFDRDSLRESILSLYPGKTEKSVFRGMVIPSLRHLGLIVGYEEDLRLSCNGKIIVLGKNKSEKEAFRVFRAVLLENDNNMLKIVKLVSRKEKNFDDFRLSLSQKIEAPNLAQAKERINHWLSMMIVISLLLKEDGKLKACKDYFDTTEKDLDASTKGHNFKSVFFSNYENKKKIQQNVAIVDIEDLRTEVAATFYKKEGLVVTEGQFDYLLRKVPFVTDEYIISLGRAMGAEEKVFKYEKNYYRTVSIRFLSKEEGE